MSLDPLFKKVFGDDEPTHFGSGWISGVLAVILGALSLAAVLCFYFPQLLTAPDFRAQYPVEFLRSLLQVVLLLACAFSVYSATVRRRKILGITGATLTSLAIALGGASVPLPERIDTHVGIGLDWFVLNLLVLAAVFVPLERSLPRDPNQLVFRPGWTTDGVHFLVSHLLVQLFTVASLSPSLALRAQWIPSSLIDSVQSLPFLVQFFAVMLCADFTQYWVHRAFHKIPWLWRFHAVHHSSTSMDWLAGSRLHLFDALITRSLALAPVILLGFSQAALGAYLAFVSFHAVFIHANFGARFAWIEPFVVTPRIHHFHHAKEQEAIDTNFAVHLAFLDRLFGTRFLPKERWPLAYGIENPPSAPEGWWAQLAWPFQSKQ